MQHSRLLGIISHLTVILSVSTITCLSPSTVFCTEIYSNNFEGVVGAEWSNPGIDVTPDGSRRFLGQFHQQNISLSLSSLPVHDIISISLDLLVINTWDGNPPGLDEPDIWQVAVDGTLLFRTTFSNIPGKPQAFPDS
jgi:hypothetical protein